jgi:hypothetical protein
MTKDSPVRVHHLAAVICLVLLGSVVAACQTPVVATAASPKQKQSGAAPVLQSVSMRYKVQAANGAIVSVVPDFRFVAPNGNAVLIHRELVSTSGSPSRLRIPAVEPIDIPAEVQKKGAVLSGAWNCGVAQYYVTIRTYILDADGNQSNQLEYTIRCNGG